MIGIIFATEEEAAPFLDAYKRGRFDELREGDTLFDDDIFVSLTGLGKIKATLRTERFFQNNQPDRIIHAGTCTALNESYSVGDLVSADQVFEGDRIELAAPTYPRMPLDVFFDDLPSGTLVTQDHVASDKSEKSYWQRIADMSDMTGYAVAYVSATHGVPCHIVKAVTGHINEEDKEFKKHLTSACQAVSSFLVARLEGIGAEG